MRLALNQLLLEEAQFRHTRPDYLALPPGTQTESPVTVRVEMLTGESGKDFAVKLSVVSDAADAPYRFTVSYVALLSLDLEGENAPDDLSQRLLVTGASMAFPFVRELIANLTSRARFGVTWVAPTDFNRLVRSNEVARSIDANQG